MDIKAIKGSLVVRTDTINNYLRDISKYPLLTPDEEIELIDQIKNGSIEARQKLISCNQRFVFAIAKRYASDDKVMDLVNEGTIGLNDAIDKFDDTVGVRFLSYAVWYIRRAIIYHLSNNNLLVKKSNNMKLGTKVNNIKSKYYCENGRYPTEDEIVELLEKEFNVKIQNKNEVYDIKVDSINMPVGDDDNSTLESSDEFNRETCSFNDYEKTIEQDYADEATKILLSTLNERDAKIIRMSYGIGYPKEYTNYDIAEELGMTSERVRQIKNSALNKMKLALKYVN